MFKRLSLVLVAALSFSSQAAVVAYNGLGTGITGTTDPSAPVGDGAWSADTFGGAAPYSEYYFYFDFDTSTAEYFLGNLESVSFKTKKPTSGEQNDFFVQIYTTQDGISDGSWFGQRVTFDPRYAANINAPGNTWNTWSTNGTENILAVYDSANGFFGGYSGPTLAQLLDPAYTDDNVYSSSDVDYASEQILGIKIGTGSGWASSFEGSIDDVVFDFGNQGLLAFDLEPAEVSAPATLGLFGLGLLCALRTRKKIK
ncbi:PEP-CTERM sorting domain-containing protein [Alteromonas antoniana]|jgi:hypothetical protein|uniref:PEP-CTERM sorting domain-containing protein n=1 Tax=Alteromonas antoniana TaxID=2803813 RepID=UPI001C472D07|nr:PEP-CTERM sorting domain-containing protein [Alteromonas antoniana]